MQIFRPNERNLRPARQNSLSLAGIEAIFLDVDHADTAPAPFLPMQAPDVTIRAPVGKCG